MPTPAKIKPARKTARLRLMIRSCSGSHLRGCPPRKQSTIRPPDQRHVNPSTDRVAPIHCRQRIHALLVTPNYVIETFGSHLQRQWFGLVSRLGSS
jgi:hypothetical protein